MSLSTVLTAWRDTPTIAANIVTWRTFPARPAQTQPFPAALHPALGQVLHQNGIHALYAHQAAAWEAIQAGQHPVIVTGTASGKSLCYNLPVLDALLKEPQSRALYLFPTKALAHDQAGSLNQVIATPEHLPVLHDQLPISTYDGDTPSSARPAIRNQARIILTNPDMLHMAILPHHTRWVSFLRQLRFVVIDEMHVYRGVFGSHVANVLRRLKRVALFYGARPQFVLTSATIANPTELAGRLVEEATVLIDHDGAARGARHFLIYNPPVVDPGLGLRRSALQETVRLSRELLHQDVQTIIFGRTRRTVEMILSYLRQNLLLDPLVSSFGKRLISSDQAELIEEDISSPDQGQSEKEKIRAYRSGYLPQQRREIERGLREGKVRAVVATSALELGIDIGSMGAVLLTGYPGTIAGTWQQAGRAGRQREAALAVLVASANPLDQFLAHHPDYFFDRPVEQILINPDNLLILLQHLRCALFELPIEKGEPFGWVEPGQLTEFLQFLYENGELHQSGQKYFWMADQYPAERVSLRSASPDIVRLQAGYAGEERLIGEVDSASADWLVHPQAVYLHEGQSYLVERLDLEQQVAWLRPVNPDYYTEPLRDTSVQLVAEVKKNPVRGAIKTLGEIVVTTQVIGYQMIRWFTHERLGSGELELPPHELHTVGYWLALGPETVADLRERGLWTNDPNDYGPNWAGQRNLARARDGYRCQMCGLPEQGRSHDVHHKVPFRTFESYIQANQLTNLITLCRSCHRRAETAVRMRSGLSGLATALGHLAPFFLMCDTHDMGVHADPQSPLAEGQPAVVIYDQVPAGLGFAERLFDLHDELLSQAHKLVKTCECAEGCPSCVGPAGEAGAGGKRETEAILERLIIDNGSHGFYFG
jgi:DEAD/DEAH box helicase domain-containing protein